MNREKLAVNSKGCFQPFIHVAGALQKYEQFEWMNASTYPIKTNDPIDKVSLWTFSKKFDKFQLMEMYKPCQKFKRVKCLLN